MRNFWFVTFVAITFAFTGQLFAQNLITNGGFENAGNPGLGWNLYIADTAGFAATITYPDSAAPEGATYAHVNVTKATVNNAEFDNYKVQLQLPQWVATRNASYKLAFKARSSAVTFKVGINRGDSVGTYVNGFDILPTSSWQNYSCSFTSDTSGNGQIRLNFYVGAETGTYDFDSVTLVRLDTITAPGGNLIDNGGFESGGLGWNLLLQSGFLGTIIYPTTGAPEGTTFAQVHITQTAGTGDPETYNWEAQLQLPQWMAAKNGIYQLTFKVKSTAPTFKVGLNRGSSYLNGFDIPLDTTWQTRSCMFISDTTGLGLVNINFYMGADTGVYDFDSVSLVMTGTAAPTNNLISNGGFELQGSGWNLYIQDGTGAVASMSYPDSVAPEGTRFGRLTITTPGSDYSQVQVQLPLFTAELNAIYAVTFKARGPSGIQIESQYDASQSYAPISGAFVDLTNSWATYSDTFTSTVAGNGALRINFWLGESVPGTYDFDSVFVVKIGTVAVRPARANKALSALTIRKVDAGYAIALPGPVPKGAYALSIYSPAGRLIKSITGVRKGYDVVFLPLKSLKGTYIIRYSDVNGGITKRTCLVR